MTEAIISSNKRSPLRAIVSIALLIVSFAFFMAYIMESARVLNGLNQTAFGLLGLAVLWMYVFSKNEAINGLAFLILSIGSLINLLRILNLLGVNRLISGFMGPIGPVAILCSGLFLLGIHIKYSWLKRKIDKAEWLIVIIPFVVLGIFFGFFMLLASVW